MMQLDDLKKLIDAIQGCTFASVSAITRPLPGIRKTVIGEQVLLFNTKGDSGYERMVRRRLEQEGKDPDSFVVEDLPWGERLDDHGPIIVHKGRVYLQTIRLREGDAIYHGGNDLLGWRLLDEAEVNRRGLHRPHLAPNQQGLPDDRKVLVHTYALDSITQINMMGERVRDAGPVLLTKGD